MLFSHVSVLCLIGSALAAPAAQWGATPVSKVSVTDTIKKISEKLDRLDKALKSRPSGGDFNRAKTTTENLLYLTRDVIEESRSGSRAIRAGPSINYVESLTIGTSLTSMSTTLQSTTTQWIGSKQMVLAAGLKNEVYNTLLDASDAITVFSDTLISKLPPGTGTLGQMTKAQFVTIIELGVKEYRS
jgi:hypothetical protein